MIFSSAVANCVSWVGAGVRLDVAGRAPHWRDDWALRRGKLRWVGAPPPVGPPLAGGAQSPLSDHCCDTHFTPLQGPGGCHIHFLRLRHPRFGFRGAAVLGNRRRPHRRAGAPLPPATLPRLPPPCACMPPALRMRAAQPAHACRPTLPPLRRLVTDHFDWRRIWPPAPPPACPQVLAATAVTGVVQAVVGGQPLLIVGA